MNVGFIGLGRMGSGLAKNLIRNGYQVKLYDVRAMAIERIVSEIGGVGAASAAEAASGVEVVFVSVPLPSDLEDVLVNSGGVFKAMSPGATVIDVSTIDPQTARRLSDIATEHGLNYLECPLGKGPKQAEEGSEPIFAGGRKDVFEKHRDLLESIGNPVHYVGDVEQSTAFKIISNLIGMTNMAVLAEGLKLGEHAGIDKALLQELLAQTGADSYQLHLRGPWLLHEDYDPRFSVNLTEKDIRLGVGMASAWSVPAEFSRLALAYYQMAQQAGYGEEDTDAVYKVIDTPVK